MTNLINPRVVIKIIGVNGRNTIVIEDLDCTYDIEKELSIEPNEAEVSIYSLNTEKRAEVILAGDDRAPIEIYFTQAGKPESEPVLAFLGEISHVAHNPPYAGSREFETVINATTQKENHRLKIIEKAYTRETPLDIIFSDFVRIIGLPHGNSFTFSTTPILLGQSFNGPAFPLLRELCDDTGSKTFIQDGKLYITDRDEPIDIVAIELPESQMLFEPQDTTREDPSVVVSDLSWDIFEKDIEAAAKKKKKKKRKKKKKTVKGIDIDKLFPKPKVDDEEGYAEYEVVEKTVKGKIFTIRPRPDILLGNLVMYKGLFYLVQNIKHNGDNETFESNTTKIMADVYEVSS